MLEAHCWDYFVEAFDEAIGRYVALLDWAWSCVMSVPVGRQVGSRCDGMPRKHLSCRGESRFGLCLVQLEVGYVPTRDFAKRASSAHAVSWRDGRFFFLSLLS